MADERYEWLDHEAAERLLRGEPVDADDDYTRLQAERLAEALESARADAARTRTGPAGALPGEEAALTAFRAARSTRVDGRAPGAGRDLGAVRIGGSPRPAGRARAWTRPARWGLAASVAGLAVGGVAVAAGTGVLPDFGRDAAPVPAASASAPMELDAPDGVATPRGSTRPVTPPHPDGPTPPGASLPATGGPDATAGSDGTADNDGADRGHADDEYWAGGDKRAPGGAWPDRTTQACRDYRDGHLDTARRQQLELSAKADGGIERFCDQVLSGRVSGGTSIGATGATGDPESDGGGGGSGGTAGGKPGGGASGGTTSGGTSSGGTSSGGRTSVGTTSGGKASGGQASGGQPSGGKASGGKSSGGAGGSASAVSWTVPLTSAPRATL
ncbi:MULTISPECIES: hypothetical protein [Streptomyces]|uniref:Extensin n=2 Tax=Streptomyces TaxID=1883 RepID=A0A100Y2R9_9ACTN|nr:MULTISPECIES: hypothetical protein [Streptomyces]KUH36631.1 hypothetical protein ATE80_22460 [Streptomyces kanasensis]UUS32639.1 hypothetical protein NRO40_18670 [Streptomyces changanensis]